MNRMIRNLLAMIACGTSASVLSGSIILADYFDYGAGVTGRETVQTGDGINGLAPQIGTGTWAVAGSLGWTANFTGAAGEGNGSLTLTDAGNHRMLINLTPSGVTIASLTGTFSESSDTSTLAFGFQVASPSPALLINQTTDNVYAQVRFDDVLAGGDDPAPKLIDGDVGGTVLVPTGDASGFTFTSGDRIKVDLMVDMDAKTSSVTLANLSQSSAVVSQSTSWTGDPGWSVLAIQQTGTTTLVLDEVTVIPEPSAYVAVVGFLALVLITLRRSRRR